MSVIGIVPQVNWRFAKFAKGKAAPSSRMGARWRCLHRRRYRCSDQFQGDRDSTAPGSAIVLGVEVSAAIGRGISREPTSASAQREIGFPIAAGFRPNRGGPIHRKSEIKEPLAKYIEQVSHFDSGLFFL